MNIIITMAGEGKRFKDIGYDVPKHLIKAKGKTLFEWSILSLSNFFDNNFISLFLFILSFLVLTGVSKIIGILLFLEKSINQFKLSLFFLFKINLNCNFVSEL